MLQSSALLFTARERTPEPVYIAAGLEANINRNSLFRDDGSVHETVSIYTDSFPLCGWESMAFMGSVRLTNNTHSFIFAHF